VWDRAEDESATCGVAAFVAFGLGLALVAWS
jgi:hypothetical protein